MANYLRPRPVASWGRLPGMELMGRRVLVTGASRGIGAALAEAFAAAGARPVLVARTAGPLRDLAARLDGTALVADLTDPADLGGLIARAEAAAGGAIDVVVSNAGVETARHLADQTAHELDALYRLNLLAPAELFRQALPGMRARRSGHVVAMSSLAAVGTFPGLAAYGSSKAGLTRLTAGLRADLRGTGVGVTDVQLGPVRGDMIDRARAYGPTDAGFARLSRLRVLGELDPHEVARATVTAVHAGRGHLRLPRRAGVAGAWAEAPQRVVEVLLTGLPHQERR